MRLEFYLSTHVHRQVQKASGTDTAPVNTEQSKNAFIPVFVYSYSENGHIYPDTNLLGVNQTDNILYVVSGFQIGGGVPTGSGGITFGWQNLSGERQILSQGSRYSQPGGIVGNSFSGAPRIDQREGECLFLSFWIRICNVCK